MRYSKQAYFGAQIGAIAFAVLGCAAVMWVIPRDMLAIKALVLAGVSAIAIVIGLAAYRSADEVILHVHKTAWFWGSMIAIVLVAPVMIAVLLGILPPPQVLPFPHKSGADFFAEGVVDVLLLQCAGFAVLWAYHNLRGRG